MSQYKPMTTIKTPVRVGGVMSNCVVDADGNMLFPITIPDAPLSDLIDRINGVHPENSAPQLCNLALLAERDALNPFTELLKERCLAEGAVVVKTRCGRLTWVRYETAESASECPGFYSVSDTESLAWCLNGESLKNSDLDLVRLPENKGV